MNRASLGAVRIGMTNDSRRVGVLMAKSVRRLLLIGGIAGSFVVLAGFFGSHHPAMDLVSHFQIYMLLVILVYFVVSALFRARVPMLIALALIVVTGARIAPYWPGLGSPPVVAGAPLRVMSVNVHTSNTEHQLVLDEIRRVDPDVLVVIELSEQWERALEPLWTMYPHASFTRLPGDIRYGVAVFSRHELAIGQFPFGSDAVFLRGVAVDVVMPAGPVRLLAVHPYPPSGVRSSLYRDRQLSLINKAARESPDQPTIVIGDLNATPWSHGHRTLTRGTSLRNAALGFGVHGTWHSRLPALLRIPIDHIIVSDHIGVASFTLGADIGSDHLPIVAELLIGAVAAR